MKSKKQPLISVIIPVYNCELYVEHALRSILDQTYKNLEIIVVDDGSKDKSWQIITKLAKEDERIKPYKNKVNLKIVGTLNFALSKSSGKYIARMDGDDYRMPDSIEKQVDFFEAHPDVVLLGGAIEVCDGEMKKLNDRLYPTSDEEIRAKLFRYNPFAHPAIMMRKEALEGEEYELNWAEDYDLYFRLGNKGKMANLPYQVLKLRTHPSSVSQSKVSYQEYLTLYIRLKAVFEYGYSMTRGDKWYFAAQLISKFLMPVRLRFWLFNKIRSLKK